MTATAETIAWKARELGRFADGTYQPVPVTLDYPVDHYVHLSVTVTETDQVAYTPSDAYGVADRQIRLKFGRYLRKVFPDMSDADIQGHVTRLKSAVAVAANPVVLKFATDTDTINRIFETRMQACGSTAVSCMYGKFDSDRIRPYHVYADSPDVAVAYVTRTGDIVARSVVSTKDKVWVRAYSVAGGDNDADCGTLVQMLTDAGYERGDLYGNRLTMLATDDVMLPYIDHNGAKVRDTGSYWVVTDDDDADYQADCTDGTATALNRCDGCDRHRDYCECIYCDCCDESYPGGCQNCSMCEHCDQCTYHDHCECDRCSDCHQLVEHYRGCSHCECDRCGDCNELTDNCECSKCERCGDLTSECECEDTEDDDDGDDATSTVSDLGDAPDYVPVSLTDEQLRAKLQRIWSYIYSVPDMDADLRTAIQNLLLDAYHGRLPVRIDPDSLTIATAQSTVSTLQESV